MQNILSLTLATLGVVGALGGAGVSAYYASSAPKITNAALVGTSQTQLLDADGNVFYTTGPQARDAKQSEIPQEMRMAVISIEDRRFYKHHGGSPPYFRRCIWPTLLVHHLVCKVVQH